MELLLLVIVLLLLFGGGAAAATVSPLFWILVAIVAILALRQL